MLHNKASALGLTLGGYVQVLVRALSVVAREGFDDHPETAEEFDRAFDDGREVLPYCAVLNEADRQAAARELVGLLCDQCADAYGDGPTETLRTLAERTEPDYGVVAVPTITFASE